MTEADYIQARFDVGDVVNFPARGTTSATGIIVKLNQRTATVRLGSNQRPESWRVPYALLELANGQRRDGRAERLLEVAREARQLMDRHGLADWTFRFSAARRTIGLCREKEKVIQLGRHHAAHDPPAQVTDTILHEIAHALAGTAARHGPAWRSIARQDRRHTPGKQGGRPGQGRGDQEQPPPRREHPLSGRQRQHAITGVIVKLNRKTARVTCGDRTMLVPYGCVVVPPGLPTDGRPRAGTDP